LNFVSFVLTIESDQELVDKHEPVGPTKATSDAI